MKNWMVAVVVMASLVMPAVARAHEGHMHKALGTVSSIDGPHVMLKTTDGKNLMIMLDKGTAITRGKDKVTVSELKVGDRISVDYMEENKMMMAHTIKLATATAKK